MLRPIAGRLATATALVLSGCGTPPAAVPSAATTASSTTSVAGGHPIPAAKNAAHEGEWENAGQSVQGRPIRVKSIGTGRRHVLFIGGIHGDEPEGWYTTTQLPKAFSDQGLADTVTLTILEDANPDGRAAYTRGNANGVDVNRNFPASNFDGSNPANGSSPLSQPESRAVVTTINRVEPALVLVFHSWVNREFINFDGPARAVADRFSSTSGLLVEESNSFAPTPGSLGSYVGRDRGIPLLTIEVRKGSDPHAVWHQLERALINAIRG